MASWWIIQKVAGLRRRDTMQQIELDRLIWECEGHDASPKDPALTFGLVDALLSFAAFLLLNAIVGTPLT